MSVYVDEMRAPFGRMIMCHMLADSTEELLEIATRIGVNHKWLQKAGTPYEHFDISLSKRQLAIEHGARIVTTNELVRVIQEKKSFLATLQHQSKPKGAI